MVDTNPNEDFRSFQHFLLDSELGRARHKIFTYAVESLKKTFVSEKIDQDLNSLKHAAKVNLAFGFIWKAQSMEDSDVFT